MSSMVSLARQVDLVFKQISKELVHLSSGLIFIHIRNNEIGKFGVRHDPIETINGDLNDSGKGLSAEQIRAFRNMAIESLKHKHWTHGEIQYEFALRKNLLTTSVVFESNYNMANLLSQ
ncbi:O-methyltransferase [Marinicrinis lubricantis]|uniref:O-methyltransferase n=1 Tax=Marinicrinis lubricantis TaxID=2086470 RepID=A0ABW1INR9_9BACL